MKKGLDLNVNTSLKGYPIKVFITISLIYKEKLRKKLAN
jgi:hypothetical protein